MRTEDKIFALLVFVFFLPSCVDMLNDNNNNNSNNNNNTGVADDAGSNQDLFASLDASIAARQIKDSPDLTGLWLFYAKGDSDVSVKMGDSAQHFKETMSVATQIISIQDLRNGEFQFRDCSAGGAYSNNGRPALGYVENGLVNIDIERSQHELWDMLRPSVSVDYLEDAEPISLTGSVSDNGLIEFDLVTYQDNAGDSTGSVSVTLRARKVREDFVGKIGDFALGGEVQQAWCHKYRESRVKTAVSGGIGIAIDHVYRMFHLEGNDVFMYQAFRYPDRYYQSALFIDISRMPRSSIESYRFNTEAGDAISLNIRSEGVLPTQLDIDIRKASGDQQLNGWIAMDAILGD